MKVMLPHAINHKLVLVPLWLELEFRLESVAIGTLEETGDHPEKDPATATVRASPVHSNLYVLSIDGLVDFCGILGLPYFSRRGTRLFSGASGVFFVFRAVGVIAFAGVSVRMFSLAGPLSTSTLDIGRGAR
eukprot:CAMPEP_0182925254 /NCGR_PEP_ID=MMETSP0105_2-20130417/8814_1 /TAXON_ID=81532 ORGANISM="Acanthoeca-like sp., Strain 10tr" /NCGR_SAMPLE_ID=MMETSP0105_2 /ASSEMBLY_ACC=CAM_ASM_000205 /LENGTH=131 /DNA_ID=CAMNT_0025063091 /DNA_START=254 /DNA_END=650 /DNA_ORIENTATION=+